jgi:hypothetical protein
MSRWERRPPLALRMLPTWTRNEELSKITPRLQLCDVQLLGSAKLAVEVSLHQGCKLEDKSVFFEIRVRFQWDKNALCE